MHTRILNSHDPDALPAALKILADGGLVAFPTDTVYGLAAGLFNIQGIDQLYTVKGRSNTKAIAVLVSQASDLDHVSSGMNSNAQRLAERFWPGPLTLVVPGHPELPPNLSPLPTVGVRMPDHPIALALLRAAGPLAVTSANLSGHESPSTVEAVLKQLNGRISLVIDGGQTPGGISSTVVNCTTEQLVILRDGPISLKQLNSALQS